METSIKINDFDPIKERFIQLTSEETFFKEASFALQIMQKNPYLLKMDKGSILTAVLNISQLNLTLNPTLKLAYLVPRKGQCCLEISYVGLVKLATDTGSIKNIYAHCIYSNDIFKQSLGTNPEILHEPPINNRGEMTGVYAIAILQDGNKQIEVMSVEDIIEIRNTSESYKAYLKNAGSCIWVDHFDEMSRKTVIKRLCKYLPKTEMWDKLGRAIEILDEDYAISYNQAQYIESLLHQSTIPEERKEWISKTLNTMKRYEAEKLIEELKQKQVDPVNSLGYNQTDIKENLARLK